VDVEVEVSGGGVFKYKLWGSGAISDDRDDNY
jgi:hypothetical protein